MCAAVIRTTHKHHIECVTRRRRAMVEARDGIDRQRRPFQDRLPDCLSGLKWVDVIDETRAMSKFDWDGVGSFGLISVRACSRMVRAEQKTHAADTAPCIV